jgi:probable phosphoglycerate mutase
MHLYLIRHGQSFVNLPDWDQGFLDVGLTELGLQQAAALANWLPGELPTIDVLYCSTMLRARETVAPLAQAYQANIRFDDRLREIGNNRRDHTPWPAEAPPPAYVDFWGSERPFAPVVQGAEAGESFMHFRTRVGMFVEEIAQHHREQIVVAVCHGGVVDAVFDHAFNVGPWRRCEIWDHNTGITYFEYVEHPGREWWRLHYHNRIGHLRAAEKSS